MSDSDSELSAAPSSPDHGTVAAGDPTSGSTLKRVAIDKPGPSKRQKTKKAKAEDIASDQADTPVDSAPTTEMEDRIDALAGMSDVFDNSPSPPVEQQVKSPAPKRGRKRKTDEVEVAKPINRNLKIKLNVGSTPKESSTPSTSAEQSPVNGEEVTAKTVKKGKGRPVKSKNKSVTDVADEAEEISAASRRGRKKMNPEPDQPVEKAEKVERADQDEKAEKAEKVEKVEKAEKVEDKESAGPVKPAQTKEPKKAKKPVRSRSPSTASDSGSRKDAKSEDAKGIRKTNVRPDLVKTKSGEVPTSTPTRPMPHPPTKSNNATPDPNGVMLQKTKKPVAPQPPRQSLLANTLKALQKGPEKTPKKAETKKASDPNVWELSEREREQYAASKANRDRERQERAIWKLNAVNHMASKDAWKLDQANIGKRPIPPTVEGMIPGIRTRPSAIIREMFGSAEERKREREEKRKVAWMKRVVVISDAEVPEAKVKDADLGNAVTTAQDMEGPGEEAR